MLRGPQSNRPAMAIHNQSIPGQGAVVRVRRANSTPFMAFSVTV